MSESEYRSTLFDRHGPDAGLMLRAAGYGILVFGLTAGTILLRIGSRWWALPVALIAGTAMAGSSWWLANGAGKAWSAMFVDGSSTPYAEQYSYQQSLVMQGKINEALASFEAIVGEQPHAVAPRLKAAELYVRDKQNHIRAAELLREAQRSPWITTGEEVYVANRLADLYAGPLAAPGRALVELRRLVDRHPGTPAAAQARLALQELKTRGSVKR